MINVFLLGITSLLTDISTEMIYPIVPLYLTTLGATPAIVGLIEGIAESLVSLLKVISGIVSDKLKRRKIVVFCGYSLSALGKLFLYLSTLWSGVLLSRIVDRFGKGIRTAPRDALIADSTDKKIYGKAYGFHRMMDTFGATIGVFLAYLFFISAGKSYKTIFLFSLFPAVLGLVTIFFVHEKVSFSQNQSLQNFFHIWKNLDRRLKAFFGITFIFTLGNSSNMFILLRAKNLGFSAENVILLYLLFNIIYTFFSYPAGIVSDKFGRKNLIISGYFIYGIVYLCLALINKAFLVWLILGLYGLYAGLTEGIEKAFISDFTLIENRATLLGFHATLVGIGLFPASFIAGLLWNIFDVTAPFYFGAMMSLLATLGLLLFI